MAGVGWVVDVGIGGAYSGRGRHAGGGGPGASLRITEPVVVPEMMAALLLP